MHKRKRESEKVNEPMPIYKKKRRATEQTCKSLYEEKKTQMYQKYARLREKGEGETYTDKGKHNNRVYKHK
jgi:hypothetical protein